MIDIKKFLIILTTAFTIIQTSEAKNFIIENKNNISLCNYESDDILINTTLNILNSDFNNVFGININIQNDNPDIIIGTIHNIDFLNKCGIKTDSLQQKKQSFIIEVNKQGQLIIAGSDKYGISYGLIELSRIIGVSPWEWWADCNPDKKDRLVINKNFKSFQSPSVEYRGIFINDEDWGILPWGNMNYERDADKSAFGPKTYEKIFELLLRLKANTIWPAMHECTKPFFLSPGNKEAASKYGIYIGSSHCEPMVCNAAGEWKIRGNGQYDYVNNSNSVLNFWEQRISDVYAQNNIYTLGMRGVHDGKMQGAKTVEEQKTVLNKVINDQRELLKKYLGNDITNIPQTFIPYKEVLDIYNSGLQVPDDITLIWCDDNYGYIRHFPTESEKSRTGGNGIYYHVSYWGRPHDYLWLGTSSPGLLYQQMNLAFDKGIRKMWILNVGDIKPSEYQIELFLDLAWNNNNVREEGLNKHLEKFLSREFGIKAGKKLKPLLDEHYRLAYIRKPEFMGNTRVEESDPKYKIITDLPWSFDYINERLNQYEIISSEIENISCEIKESKKDAYFQLVKYPVLAAFQMNRKMLYAQLSRHEKCDISQSDLAYDSIISLSDTYNNKKWKGIMDYKPRKLPVFNRVNENAIKNAVIDNPKIIFSANGSEATSGNPITCEMLGYEGKAALIEKNKSIGFDFKTSIKDSIEFELCFVPTHPVSGNELRVEVNLNKENSIIINYATKGRSEEWKINTLQNQSVKKIKLPSDNSRKQTIYIKALDEGIIIDKINCLDN